MVVLPSISLRKNEDRSIVRGQENSVRIGLWGRTSIGQLTVRQALMAVEFPRRESGREVGKAAVVITPKCFAHESVAISSRVCRQTMGITSEWFARSVAHLRLIRLSLAYQPAINRPRSPPGRRTEEERGILPMNRKRVPVVSGHI